MKKTVTHIYAREIDFDLIIDVNFLDIRILTATGKEILGDCPVELEDKLLVYIIMQSTLEEFESISDGVAYTRPRLLIAFGFLSFFTQKIFTPFETYQHSAYVGVFNRTCTETFTFESIDYFEEFKLFNTILSSHEDTKFIFSLLDRWRKGLYMEEESQDSMLYDEEALLAYFHILELITTKYENKQKTEIKGLINTFTTSVYKDSFLFDQNKMNSEISRKIKIIENIILPELSVGDKIFYMLKEQGLLNSSLKIFINDFIKNRNSVAHGRQVYQDRVIFPVPPFFPLIKDKIYDSAFYRFLTARVIANYIGVNLYKNEWNQANEQIPPPFSEVKDFFINKEYEKLSNQDFCNGTYKNITPYIISHYLVLKKLKPLDALKILTPFINKYKQTEEETNMSIWAVIIILDIIDDENLKNKCIEIIKTSATNNWHPSYFKMRDEMYALEYLGFEVSELRELIKNKIIK